VTRINDLGATLALTNQLPGTAYVVPTMRILVTLIMEVIRCSETSVLTRDARRKIQEEGIIHSHHRVNLKSSTALTGWAL
jgi:hypothetical protein